MKRKMGIFFVILFGLSSLFFSGCELLGLQDGHVTVLLTNAGSAPGDYLYVFIYAEGETDVDNEDKVLATSYGYISSGTADVLLAETDGNVLPNKTTWIGNGGTTYDIYIYTSDSSNSPDSYAPSQKKEPFPGTVRIDGNIEITVDYATMVPYTPVP